MIRCFSLDLRLIYLAQSFLVLFPVITIRTFTLTGIRYTHENLIRFTVLLRLFHSKVKYPLIDPLKVYVCLKISAIRHLQSAISTTFKSSNVVGLPISIKAC